MERLDSNSFVKPLKPSFEQLEMVNGSIGKIYSNHGAFSPVADSCLAGCPPSRFSGE